MILPVYCIQGNLSRSCNYNKPGWVTFRPVYEMYAVQVDIDVMIFLLLGTP